MWEKSGLICHGPNLSNFFSIGINSNFFTAPTDLMNEEVRFWAIIFKAFLNFSAFFLNSSEIKKRSWKIPLIEVKRCCFYLGKWLLVVDRQQWHDWEPLTPWIGLGIEPCARQEPFCIGHRLHNASRPRRTALWTVCSPAHLVWWVGLEIRFEIRFPIRRTIWLRAFCRHNAEPCRKHLHG